MTRPETFGRTLPRRRVEVPPDLARAVEHARILRGAGDAAGASRVLDRAFDAEGVRTRTVSEPLRFRALVLRAELALALHDGRAATRYLDRADSLDLVAEALAGLDGDVHQVEELREQIEGREVATAHAGSPGERGTGSGAGTSSSRGALGRPNPDRRPPEDRMLCPIDQNLLVMAERKGVEIDYCPACRGVWLDRGELDKIIDRSLEAEIAAEAGVPVTPAPVPSTPTSYPPTPPADYGTPRGDRERERPGDGRDRRYDDRDRRSDDRDRRYDDRDRRYDGRDDPRYRKRKKKESWLEDLFDF
ncbi:zf-TFIIB domain-containing protein [Cellulosimicrobium arenosum]